MSGNLYFKDLAKGIIAPEAIDEKSTFDFLVTFKTRAYEEGHVLWLKREFESWFKKIREIPGVLDAGHLGIKKAFDKSKLGSIELGIKITGGFKAVPDANTIVTGNVVSAIRKSAAEIILTRYSPKFNYERPLFYAIHDHCYQATPCCSDWKKGNRRLKALRADHNKLRWQFDACGAILKDVNILSDNNVISMAMRWRLDADEIQRNTLIKVIRAYFAGLGFTLTDWQCKSLEN